MNDNLEKIRSKLKEKNVELSKITCCFTGHRPQNLPWGFNEQDKRCVKMKKQLKLEILKAIKKGYTTFISGMALGFDMICAEIVLKLKRKYPQIKLIGAVPCKTQDKLWNEKDKCRYRTLLSKIDGIRCIYDNYNGYKCMHERNCFMVNNSSLIIALWSGKSGGTKNTLEYAKKQNLSMVIIKV